MLVNVEELNEEQQKVVKNIERIVARKVLQADSEFIKNTIKFSEGQNAIVFDLKNLCSDNTLLVYESEQETYSEIDQKKFSHFREQSMSNKLNLLYKELQEFRENTHFALAQDFLEIYHLKKQQYATHGVLVHLSSMVMKKYNVKDKDARDRIISIINNIQIKACEWDSHFKNFLEQEAQRSLNIGEKTKEFYESLDEEDKIKFSDFMAMGVIGEILDLKESKLTMLKDDAGKTRLFKLSPKGFVKIGHNCYMRGKNKWSVCPAKVAEDANLSIMLQ